MTLEVFLWILIAVEGVLVTAILALIVYLSIITPFII